MTADPMTIVVPLRTRRRAAAEKAESVLQLPPALSLLLAARARLASPGPHTLALIELGTSAALIVAVLRSLRGRRARWGVSSVDLAAGLMLGAEWWDAVSNGHHWFSPTLLSALTAIVLALVPVWAPDWKERRRAMRLDSDGLRYRQSALRRFDLRWRDVTAVVDRGSAIELHCADGGRRRIGLSALVDRDEVRDAVLAAAARAGIPIHATATGAVVA